MTTTVRRTCPLCEATCGLLLDLEDDRIVGVRGDDDHPLSRGFICPKGAAFGQLDHDPSRLSAPLVRRNGALVEASWEEAFQRVDEGIAKLDDTVGRGGLAMYVGNPTIHNLAGQLYLRPLRDAMRPAMLVSASTVDQMPKHRSAGEMYGDPLAIPVPDIDNTDLLVILGGNPMMSNGSLWTVPDFPRRMRDLRSRGGRVVVVDPRRSRTAAKADVHIAPRPGSDALLLAAVVNHLLATGQVTLGAMEGRVEGLDDLAESVRLFTPAMASGRTGLDSATIESLADEIAAADRACVYGRIGTTTTQFGTLASWLVDAVNIITGNLDRPGTMMFPRIWHEDRRGRKPQRFGRFTSRVAGHPEVLGEFPAACLTEEIQTPGEGQIRAMIISSGNPVLSTPDGAALSEALASLEFMVSVDPYVTATSRHADVILPPPPNRYRGHADLGFAPFFVRHVVQYTPPPLPLPSHLRSEEEIFLRLAAIGQGAGPDVDVDMVDDLVAMGLANQLASRPGARTNGLGPDELVEAVAPRRGSERLLDLLLRSGPVGDGFGETPEGLTMDRLAETPSGADLGPLETRIDEVVLHESGHIQIAPPALMADMARLVDGDDVGDQPLLVGRRHLRSNNSWMHNLPMLDGAQSLCTLHVNPKDAMTWGLEDGAFARVSTTTGSIVIRTEVTDDIRPGVVSIPHGYGHDLPDAQAPQVEQDGPNVNALLNQQAMDPLSGTSALTAVAVAVSAA